MVISLAEAPAIDRDGPRDGQADPTLDTAGTPTAAASARGALAPAPAAITFIPPQGSPLADPVVTTRRRRVLIAADTYPPDENGTAHVVHRLAAGLSARGNEVHVVCQSADGRSRVEMMDGVVVYRLKSAPAPVGKRVALPVRLDRLVAGLAPDVVHVHGHLVVGRAAIAAARRRNVPVVATNHVIPDPVLHTALPAGGLRTRLRSLMWQDLARVFDRADVITTPASGVQGVLPGRAFGRWVETVSPGVDLMRFRPRLEPRAWARNRFGLPDRDTVLFVGRLHEDKRVDELIRALPYLLKETDAQLAIVGSGRRRGALERLAERLGLGDRVHLLGFVPERSMPQVYATANVFAMPGSSGLRTSATLEAMASGLPVVAADLPALSHLVHDGENGHLYAPGDVRVLGRHLANLLDAPDALEALGQRSFELAAGYGEHVTLSRFEEIYAEVDR
ncbi:glycosyltransferase [Sinosporangium siamense]|uniref:Glycosyltransferase subfamily 4-like N-terminal domain-containing protein n=1 Tax=Sinosporangium siamense TaxID=1367973 RepID=A0A919RGM9_9ACTN|nr:glycosyltransferase [Sinosporangium siamense]GII91464.1 hypothetical protein Ssi02_16950 [Sinosporangium siamense]